MRIELDPTPPSGVLRGRVRPDDRSAAGPATVEIGVTERTPFGERYEAQGEVATDEGRFEIPEPGWPPTTDGELLGTAWTLTATSPTGETASIGIAVDAGPLVVESVDDDDLAGPARPVDLRVPAVASALVVAGIVALVTAFGTGQTAVRVIGGFVAFFAAVPLVGWLTAARRRVALGEVRCRVEPGPDRLDVIVAASPRRDPPDATTVAATLLVAEMSSASEVAGGPADREHVVVEHRIDLALADRRVWRGVIPLAVASAAPASRAGRDGDVSWAISWVVRIEIDAPGMPRYRRVMPLVALPAGLPADRRPGYVEIPRAAR